MPIPTPHDKTMNALTGEANGILLTLGVLHRAGPGDVERLRRSIKQQLRDFVDDVLAVADQ